MSELQSPNPPIGSLSLEFVEGLLADYTRNPDSVAPDWRRYFDELTHGQNGGAVESTGNGHAGLSGNGDGNGSTFKQLGPSFRPVSLFKPPRPAHAEIAPPPTQRPRVPAEQWNIAVSQDRVDQLIRAYRVRGHLVAQIDPLGLPRPALPELELSFYGLTEADLDREFSTATIEGPQSMTLRRIIERLRNTYCRSIGVQFYHMDDLKVRRWLQERMEGTENRCVLSRKEQLRILNGLTSAAVFEEFIQRRFLGAKSFSLEGAETLIPLLDLAIEKAGEHNIDEIVLAMAHRGRLNVLANVMGKSPQQIFREFADIDPELHIGRGDVKYHLGHSTDIKTSSGHPIHLSLCFNPSHLEFVNPVAIGRVRAKQDRVEDKERRRGMALLIHGDAAFAGEGSDSGNAEFEPARCLRNRRHAARRAEQSNRFHDRPERRAQHHLRHRRGQNAANSNLPRQRRRSRSRGAGDSPGDGFSPRVPARRGGRHVLLPPPRAQRGRRTRFHAAAAVSGDRRAQERA